MLVLTRKRNETVILDTLPRPTKIAVVEIRPNSVRLGFDAPDEISITRPDAISQEPRSRDGEGLLQ